MAQVAICRPSCAWGRSMEGIATIAAASRPVVMSDVQVHALWDKGAYVLAVTEQLAHDA